MTQSILRLYDAEMRKWPPSSPGLWVEHKGAVVRMRGDHNEIVYVVPTETSVGRIVAEQAAFFRSAGEPLEWKVFAHDAPPGLDDALRANRFSPEDSETFMALDLKAPSFDLFAERDGSDVRRVENMAGLETYIQIATLAFGSAPKSSRERLTRQILGEGADTHVFIA